MNLEKRVAKAMLEIIAPSFARGNNFTSIDIDDSDIDFEELARAAIAEIGKSVWVYEAGRETMKVFASEEAAQKWLDENDPDGVAFAHEVNIIA